MKNVRVAVECGYYEKDDNFNLQEHLSKSFGAFQEVPMKIKLLFSDKVKDRIQNYNVHPNQEMELKPAEFTKFAGSFSAGEKTFKSLRRRNSKTNIKNCCRKLLKSINDTYHNVLADAGFCLPLIQF